MTKTKRNLYDMARFDNDIPRDTLEEWQDLQGWGCQHLCVAIDVKLAQLNARLEQQKRMKWTRKAATTQSEIDLIGDLINMARLYNRADTSRSES